MSEDQNNKMTVKDAFAKQLDRVREEADKVCSEYIKTAKISALLLAEAQKTPDIYECMKTPRGRTSIVNFYMLAAQLGLEPGSAMQMLYAIPKKMKGEYCILPVIGYKGYCELAHRTGKIKRIAANAFYEGEVNESLVITKEPPDVRHTYDPSIDESDEKLCGVYAMVETEGGGRYLLVMNREKIIGRAKRGGSWNAEYSPWKTDFAAMARKTVLRALLSGGLVPISTELRTAISQDGDGVNDEEHTQETTRVEVERHPQPRKTTGEDDVVAALKGNVIDVTFDDAPPPPAKSQKKAAPAQDIPEFNPDDDNPFDPASL
jgi:recombination protein RecT